MTRIMTCVFHCSSSRCYTCFFAGDRQSRSSRLICVSCLAAERRTETMSGIVTSTNTTGWQPLTYNVQEAKSKSKKKKKATAQSRNVVETPIISFHNTFCILLDHLRTDTSHLYQFIVTHRSQFQAYQLHDDMYACISDVLNALTMYSRFTTVESLHSHLSKLVHTSLLIANAITSSSDVPCDIKLKMLNVTLGSLSMYLYVRETLSSEDKVHVANALKSQCTALHFQHKRDESLHQLLTRPEVIYPINYYSGTPTEVKAISLSAVTQRIFYVLPAFKVPEPPQDGNMLSEWCRTFAVISKEFAFPISPLARSMIREILNQIENPSLPQKCDVNHIQLSDSPNGHMEQTVQMATPMYPQNEIYPYLYHTSYQQPFHTPYRPTANSYPSSQYENPVPMYPVHMDNHTFLHKLNQAIHMAQAQTEILQGIINFLNQNRAQ